LIAFGRKPELLNLFMGINVFFAVGASGEVLISLLIILAAAKLMAEIFERLKQPAVVGEILAGVLIGPSVFGWVQPNEIITLLAEIGVIFLLFNVGLETKPQAIFKVGKSAFWVAVIGVVTPFITGFAVKLLWGGSMIDSLFVAAAMVATSVGITARVLGNLGVLDAPTARIILGAAVIDDILGLLVLAVVSSVAGGDVSYLKLIFIAVSAIGFTAFAAVVGAPLLTRLSPHIEKLRIGEPFFVAGLILCFSLAVLASYSGVAVIIGAFLAGMAMAEATENNVDMRQQTRGLTEFFVPFFLVNIGMQLKLDVFSDRNVILLAIVVTIIATVTKIVSGLGIREMGWQRIGQVGIGMIPRGEVGIVVAQIGLGLGVITNQSYAVVLFMAVATTLIAPPFLKFLYSSEEAFHSTIAPNDAGGILATHGEDDPPAIN
jgi:Kef-type K+ transport system membrane component KefB